MPLEISYDPAKNAANIERRGLPFEQVADLDWRSSVITEDARKAYAERRFRVFDDIGERLYTTVFTPHGTAVHVIGKSHIVFTRSHYSRHEEIFRACCPCIFDTSVIVIFDNSTGVHAAPVLTPMN